MLGASALKKRLKNAKAESRSQKLRCQKDQEAKLGDQRLESQKDQEFELECLRSQNQDLNLRINR